ncbi:MAG: hypothetical protein IJO32_07160 [Bacilli bacterium]|nr:hypothetical protein [Bacilli bacterium]
MQILTEYKNRLIKLNTHRLKKVGNGYEGNVYKYKDIAIKLYRKKPKKTVLSYNEVIGLKYIDTQRILLPISAVHSSNLFSKQSFSGYSTNLVQDVKDIKFIINIDSNHLYNEINILENDIRNLSNNKVKINDLWNIKNFVFNGNLYFVDPGSYYFKKDSSNSDIFDENMEELSMALYQHLFCLDSNLEYIGAELMNMNIEHSNVNLKSILPLIGKIYEDDYHKHFLKSNKKFYLEYLKYILDKYETISNYKLNVFKEYITDSNNDAIYVKNLKKIIK